MEQLIELYDQYINLLGDELNELSAMASIRGWKSTRIKDGEDLRDKIEKQRTKIITDREQAEYIKERAAWESINGTD